MSRNNQPNGKAAEGRLKVVKLNCSSLIVLLTLCLSAVAVAVFVAGYSIFHWDISLCDVGEAPPQQCTERHINPLLLQMQVLGDNDSSSREVVVAFEKDQWAYEIVEALRQIQQTLENNGSSAINVVVDPKENPWIDKLINALRDAGELQPAAPVIGENFISNVVIPRDKNPWIDELLAVLHKTAETQVTDAIVREYIEKQVRCAGDENSSAECPASESVERSAVAPDLSERIWEQMGCPVGNRLKMSGFIRFSNNDASINDAAKKMIDNFLRGIDKQRTKWGVFGFASEAGEKKRNRELSWQRACKVTKHISDKYNCATSGLDCKTCPKGKNGKVDVRYKSPTSGHRETEFLIRFPGEDHFINGVADSRSVVIAACKAKE